MRFCGFGSEKKSSAPDYIFTDDIGALCFLFGLEGRLCRLLDLVPEAIQKIATLDPDNLGSANEKVINKLLKKAGKKLVGIAYNDLFGGISTADFCTLEPPPEPEPISYYDIYSFISGLVPILSYFFKFNDILTENKTKLLDKIVQTWLRQQWFIHCQCKTQPAPPPQVLQPPLNGFGYSVGCAAITRENTDAMNRRVAANQLRDAISNAESQREYDEQAPYEDDNRNPLSQAIQNAIDAGCEVLEVRDISEGVGKLYLASSSASYFGCAILTENRWSIRKGLWPTQEVVIKCDSGPDRSTFCQNVLVCGFVTTTYDLDSSECDCYRPYPDPPPEIKPPPSFCDLFPDSEFCTRSGCTDPIASNYDDLAIFDDGSCLYGCDTIDIEVVQFVGCGSDRTTKIVQLFDSGDFIDIEVVQFAGCGSDRTNKIVQLFDCV
jgi:hypothetical protein